MVFLWNVACHPWGDIALLGKGKEPQEGAEVKLDIIKEQQKIVIIWRFLDTMTIETVFRNTVDKHWYSYTCLKQSSESSEICPSLEKFNEYYFISGIFPLNANDSKSLFSECFMLAFVRQLVEGKGFKNKENYM